MAQQNATSFSSPNPTYYVSAENGKDSWSGTLAAPNGANNDGPFKTITRAHSALRTSSIVRAVSIRAGKYKLAAPLAFTYADNGETWAAYPGDASPILDGGGLYGIKLTGSSGMTFEGITFANLSAGGIYFNGGNHFRFQFNTFLNCNRNCLSGGAVTNSTFYANTIDGQFTPDASGAQAFYLSYGSSNNHIANNLVENCQGGGIAFAAGPSDPPNNSNVIDRNTLINVNSSFTDMGAIYIYDASHSAVGNQITNNVINGNGMGSSSKEIKAIYLDDLVSHVLVSGNICIRCGQYGFQIHGGDHNTITNNIFDLSSGAQLGFYQVSPIADPGMAGNIIRKNIVYFSGSAPPSLYTVYKNPADALPIATGNMYYSATGASIPNGATIVDASPVYSNPQFADVAAGNYSMPGSSPAFSAIGFTALPINQGPLSKGFPTRKSSGTQN